MGRSITPRYALYLDYGRASGWGQFASAWDCRRDGRPTVANVERFVSRFVKTQYVGGVNAHIAAAAGFVVVPVAAWVVEQTHARRGVVARWDAPAFWALP
jgi:hypothetical protein